MNPQRITYPIYGSFGDNLELDIKLVDGWQVSEHLAARRDAGRWSLDHLPSGMHVPHAYRRTLGEIRLFAQRLERLADLSKIEFTSTEIRALRAELCCTSECCRGAA